MQIEALASRSNFYPANTLLLDYNLSSLANKVGGHMIDRNALILLKLGGSLITEKSKPNTARVERLRQLAHEIAKTKQENPDLLILIGHGSGSFGHVAGQKYGTRQGVTSESAWRGFVEVWRAAQSLNRLVMDALLAAGLPAICFPPSAGAVAKDGTLLRWELHGITKSLEVGLTPVVYGDVVFDLSRGGTIISTEELFTYLATQLHPHRILLAGIERGVWLDYPTCQQLVGEINPSNLNKITSDLHGAAATDVTGGMQSKVYQSMELIRQNPGLEIFIFSGLEPGNLHKALSGESPGTRLYIDSDSDLD